MRTRGVTLQQPPPEEVDDSDEDRSEQPGVIEKYFSGLFGTGGGEEDSEEGRGLEPSADGADEERCDLEGLYGFFDELQNDGVKLVETTYIVNKWALGGIIPFTHHGFCFKTSRGEYFSLDFSRKGIVWDTYGDEPPELPDGTTFTQVFRIDADPAPVRRYCEETKPFQWMKNDCESWSQGLMVVLDISATQQQRRTKQVCGALQPPLSAHGAPSPGADRRGDGRRQRAGDCL